MQQVADGAILTQQVTAVPEDCRAEGKPAKLLQVLHRVTEQSSGKEDQHNAHDTEKHAKVEPVAQAINEETEHQGSNQAEGGTDQKQQAVCLESDCQRENGRFQALAANRAKREQAQRKTRTGSARFRG